jgi:hypothetical protein
VTIVVIGPAPMLEVVLVALQVVVFVIHKITVSHALVVCSGLSLVPVLVIQTMVFTTMQRHKHALLAQSLFLDASIAHSPVQLQHVTLAV